MPTFEHLSIDDAKLMIGSNNITLVDIRDPNSFTSGHIDGAHHLSNENLADFLQDADMDKPVIVYCYHGHSSQPAAEFLAQQGFEEVYSLIGGYTAWENQLAAKN